MNDYEIKPANTLATTRLKEKMIRHIQDGNKVLRMNLGNIFNAMDDDFNSYKDNYVKEIMRMDMRKIFRSEQEAMTNIDRLKSMLDHLWALENGNIFVMDFERAMRVPIITDIADYDLSAIEDAYLNFTVNKNGKRVNTSVYMSILEGVEDITTSRYNNMKTHSLVVGDVTRSTIEYEVHFTKELYPRLLKLSEPEKCSGCNQRINIELNGNDPIARVDACLMRRQRDTCYVLRHQLNPLLGISIFCYIATMFKNRKTLNRKNSRHIKDYNSTGNIDVVARRTEKRVDEAVPLLLYAKEEGKRYKTKRGSKHSYHQSPREHIRREHTRTLKSGKVVKVKQSVVNKGNNKTVYRVP